MFTTPKLPNGIMKTLKKINVTGGAYSPTTGLWVDGTPIEVSFKGAILPLSQDDLQYNDGGTYTRNDRKVYTYDTLKKGQKIKDNNDVEYTVDSDSDYDYISSFKRYYIKRVGASSD